MPILERFLSHVDASPDPETCDMWNARTNRLGYGQFWDGTYTASERPRMVDAHRWIYLHTHGPTRLHVRHTCDIRACVKLGHLISGTQADNMRDRDSRGRGVVPDMRGFARGHGTKLTAEQVLEIRTRATGQWGEQRRLAREFGVGHQTISAILSGRRWAE
jgi:hypothetical protein